MQNLDRRSFTALSGLAALGAAMGVPVRGAHAAEAAPRSVNRALRFAHFTDTHITPDRDSAAGMKKAFEAAQADGIEMILTGGDLIMDSFETKRAQVDASGRSSTSSSPITAPSPSSTASATTTSSVGAARRRSSRATNPTSATPARSPSSSSPPAGAASTGTVGTSSCFPRSSPIRTTSAATPRA